MLSCNPIPASAAEQEQSIGKWIQVELLLNQRRQAVYPTVQIGVAAGDVHLVRSGEITQQIFRVNP